MACTGQGRQAEGKVMRHIAHASVFASKGFPTVHLLLGVPARQKMVVLFWFNHPLQKRIVPSTCTLMLNMPALRLPKVASFSALS